MSDFRTELSAKSFVKQEINHQSTMLIIGSCFAQNIGNKLHENKFNTLNNPYGITFNPISIANQLSEVILSKLYHTEHLIERDQLFFSHNHHSSFFSENKLDLVSHINANIKKSNQFLKNSTYLFITFGSAWIYKNVEHNFIVNNCHKLPLQKFRKKLLSIDDIKNAYCYSINKLAEFNTDLKIIFTVSPVRHLKEGLVESQRSKAILLESIHQIIAENVNCSYFPAYEIMMDDLRDYRFYESDMIHPTQKAIEYIWQKFSECYFDKSTITLNTEIESINKSILHKPFYPQSENYKILLKNILEKIKLLEKNLQEKFTKEKVEISNLLNE